MANTETHTTPDTRRQLRETGGLLSEIMAHGTALLRGEVSLFRAEIDQNLRKAGTAIGLIIAGVVLFLVSLNVLASALVAAIVELGLEPGWAALIVGAGFALIAAIFARKGMNDLKLTSLAPTRTTRNVERDSETVKKAL